MLAFKTQNSQNCQQLHDLVGIGGRQFRNYVNNMKNKYVKQYV